MKKYKVYLSDMQGESIHDDKCYLKGKIIFAESIKLEEILAIRGNTYWYLEGISNELENTLEESVANYQEKNIENNPILYK